MKIRKGEVIDLKKIFIIIFMTLFLGACASGVYNEDGVCIENCAEWDVTAEDKSKQLEDAEEIKKEVKPVKEEPKKEESPEENFNKAFDSFHFTVIETVDSRSNTGHMSIVFEANKDIGIRSQTSDLVVQTDKFIEALKDKPKSITIALMENDQRVFQFSIIEGERTLDKASPEITDYLMKKQLFK